MKKIFTWSLLLCLMLCACGNTDSKHRGETLAQTTVPNTAASTEDAAYTVIFLDYDETVLNTQKIEPGQKAAAPEVPAKENMTFVGWDKNFNCVTEDITVTAQYTQAVNPTIMVVSMTAKPGQSVKLPVVVVNNPGVAGAKITMFYDPSLVLSTVQSGTAFSKLDYTGPGKFVSPCNFTWDSESGEATENGEILYLTFEVPKEASTGQTYAVNCVYREGDIYDKNLNDVTIEVISGVITVE